MWESGRYAQWKNMYPQSSLLQKIKKYEVYVFQNGYEYKSEELDCRSRKDFTEVSPLFRQVVLRH